MLDAEKEKRQLDQLIIKCILSEPSWQVLCEIMTYISDFHYGSILFNRNFAQTSCLEFRRPTDKAFVYCDIPDD